MVGTNGKRGIQYKGMTKDATELLKDALSLPAEARAALADSLLESLDAELDEDAWRKEIEQRLEQIDRGVVQSVRWEDAQHRLWARLRR